jgi:hypothetical protein
MCAMSVAADLDEVLARRGVALTGAEVVAEFDAALSRQAAAGAAPLTADEIEFLRRHGGEPARAVLDGWDATAARREDALAAVDQTAAAIQSSLGVAEAALLLGVDRSRVSHRLADGSLWAFRLGRSPRLPRWQFRDGRVLPGLDAVIPALPAGLAPLAVAAFMATPQPDLGGDTPVDFLAGGGDPALVAGLLADLGRW